MPRITKSMIQATHSELSCIRDLANEQHRIDGGGLVVLRYHANSANNYLDVLRRANVVLPEWLTAKSKMLISCGWIL